MAQYAAVQRTTPVAPTAANGMQYIHVVSGPLNFNKCVCKTATPTPDRSWVWRDYGHIMHVRTQATRKSILFEFLFHVWLPNTCSVFQQQIAHVRSVVQFPIRNNDCNSGIFLLDQNSARTL